MHSAAVFSRVQEGRDVGEYAGADAGGDPRLLEALVHPGNSVVEAPFWVVRCLEKLHDTAPFRRGR